MITLLSTPVKAVLFDAGGTLLKTSSVAKGFVEIASRYGYDLSLEKVSSHLDEVDDLYETLYEEDDAFWCSVNESELLWKRVYTFLARRVGVVGSDRKLIAHDMYLRYVTPDGWSLYPDVMPGLEALARRGFRMGIISNWGEGLPQIMQELGVSRHMEIIVASSDVNLRKPDAQIFEHALERMGVLAHEVAYVGDHRYADVYGSAQAGLHPVHILRDNREPGSGNPSSLNRDDVLEIGSIQELDACLTLAG